MRLSVRTAAQVIAFIALVIFLNGYIVLFYDQKRHNEVKKTELKTYQYRSLESEDSTRKTTENRNSSVIYRHLVSHAIPNDTKQKSTGSNKSSNKWLSNSSDIVSEVPKTLRYSKNTTEQPKKHNDSERGDGSNIFNPQIDYSLEFSESRPTELSDIFISVKTTKRYHKQRVDLLLNTWARLAKDETYFFTDADDKELQNKTRGHLINTNCSAVHNRVALCCKMSVEYDYYIASGKRWFCHVDDDTYINIPQLARLLQKFNYTEDWYLGKPSLTHPLEINDPDHKGQKVAFWFATGGAGVCISRSLALKMMPYTAGGRLQSVCSKIRLPDDCSIAFIIYNYLKKELTVIPKFHSHLEGLWLLKVEDMDKEITLSHDLPTGGHGSNTVHINGFSEKDDPTRFRSIHCRLFPYLEGCPKARQS